MRYLSTPALFFFGLSATGQAQTLDDLRDEFSRELSNTNIGTGYAQMLSMFLDRSVSLSRLDVENNGQTDEFDILKLPLSYDLPLGEGDWKLALRGTLSHASLDSAAEFSENDTIETEWRADSGQVGAGIVMPWSEHGSASAIAEVGISKLENDASYRGLLAESLAPIVDGILLNWDTNVAVYSLRAGIDYNRLANRRSGYQLKGRYTYSYIDSFSESRALPPVNADTRTLTLTGEYHHPWGLSVGDYPLYGIVNVGATSFLGADRDALGFKYYYQAGYSVALDISARNGWVKSFSIGYQWNEGDNVSGQSLLFNWELH